MRSVDDLTATARIRDSALELFGRDGFNVSVRAIATAADVSPSLVIHHFGSKEKLRKACDDYVADLIADSKSESLRNADPASWLARMAEIDSYATVMAYLVRSLQTGGELARTMWRHMIDNAERYLDEGVAAGTLKPSRDPRARAKFLALAGAGAFLLYQQQHEDPSDVRTVLRDYAAEMVLPALELYTQGLMTDATMYEAFCAQQAPQAQEAQEAPGAGGTASADTGPAGPPESPSTAGAADEPAHAV